jgi:hypothetical protein
MALTGLRNISDDYLAQATASELTEGQRLGLGPLQDPRILRSEIILFI